MLMYFNTVIIVLAFNKSNVFLKINNKKPFFFKVKLMYVYE